jgi:hypothetical protein
MSGFDNEVMFAPGERLQSSSAQDVALMQVTPTDVSRVNYTGDPNNNIAANPSSLSHDPVSGFLWLKVSGTGNTVWQRIFPNDANTITGQSGGSLSPTAGNWNIYGGTSAAGTTPVSTSGAGSTLTTNVQISQAIAATDATKIGLAAFNSANFTVDANGFVSSSGSAGFTWSSVTSATNPNSIVAAHGYIAKGAVVVTFVLPASALVGDTFVIAGYGNLWTLTQNANQSVTLGDMTSTVGVGGSVTATQVKDTMTIVCVTANTEFQALSSIGNLAIV